MKNIIFLSIFILFTFCMTDKSFANGLTSTNSNINPSEINKMIQKQGLKQTVESLYNNQKTWHMLIRNTASGKREWLEIALLLKPGTDAGASEMLDLAMGEALENSPKLVLEILKKGTVFTVPFVCNSPDVDDVRFSTYEKATIAINHRIETLEKVDNTNLKSVRNLCVENLKGATPRLKKYFNVK